MPGSVEQTPAPTEQALSIMQQGIAFGERASFPSEQNPETGGRIPAGVEQTAGHDE